MFCVVPARFLYEVVFFITFVGIFVCVCAQCENKQKKGFSKAK